MASYTIYSSTSDGWILSSSTTYSTARSGSGLTANNSDPTIEVGQSRAGSFRRCKEGFVSFDCSSVVGNASVATLSLYVFADGSDTDFTVEARDKSWSSSGLTTADWVAGASLSALTLLASRGTSGISENAYLAFTSEAALLTAVDAHGTLDMILDSSRHVAGNDPSGVEDVVFSSADYTGTSEDPKLDITTADAGKPWYYYAQLQ